jgi:predicted transcriptional regulator
MARIAKEKGSGLDLSVMTCCWKVDDYRDPPATVLFKRHGYTLKQIADHLRLHYTTISKTVKELEKKILYPKT